LPSESDAQHVGVKTCASGNCHGAGVGQAFSNVEQNEFPTWRDKDRHSRAYQALQSDAAAAIAARLGEKDASKMSACLACHSDNVAPDRRGPNFNVADGVGCETCHGGAAPWLATHSQGSTKHAVNVAAGMYPTDEPVARAHLCMGCHMGNREHPMTHRLLGAGHPRLTLELDTFTLARPAHHVEDADYQRRKPGNSPLRTWALGQLQSVAEWVALHRQGAAALWPEFTQFECFGCHREMDAATTRGENAPMPDVSSAVMSQLLLDQILPDAGAAWKPAIQKLRSARSQSEIDAALTEIDTLDSKAIEGALAHEFTSADAGALLHRLAQRAEQGALDRHATAEQATYAAGVLVAVLKGSGTSADQDAALEAVYHAADDGSRFRADRWREALQALMRVLDAPNQNAASAAQGGP